MKIFWDTNLFIYLWEEGDQTRCTRSFATWMMDSGHDVVTSALTYGEILVHPSRRGDAARLRQYEVAFGGIDLVPFTSDVAKVFAKLRAQYPTLRAPDAIQLASAMHAKADVFVTNDARLASLGVSPELRLISLPEWENLRN